jgi:hypothetical protein
VPLYQEWLERAYAQRDEEPYLLKGDPQLRSPEGNQRYEAFPHTRLAALEKIETATSMSAPGRHRSSQVGTSLRTRNRIQETRNTDIVHKSVSF